jgi:hypothetical protein
MTSHCAKTPRSSIEPVILALRFFNCFAGCAAVTGSTRARSE